MMRLTVLMSCLLMMAMPILAAGEGGIDFEVFNNIYEHGKNLSGAPAAVVDADAVVPELTEAKTQHWDFTTAGTKNMDDSDETAYQKSGFTPDMEDSGFENTNGVNMEDQSYSAARDDPDLDNERAQEDRGCFRVTAGAAPATAGIYYEDGSVVPVHKDANVVLAKPGRFCPEPVAQSACRDATPPELKAAWGRDTSCEALKGQCGAHMGSVEEKCPVTCGLCTEGGEAEVEPVHCYAVVKGDISPQPGTFYPKKHPYDGVIVHSAGVAARGAGKFCPDPDTDAHPGFAKDQPHYHADPASDLPMPPTPRCSDVWSAGQCSKMKKMGACHYHVLDNCKLTCGGCANGHMPMIPGAEHPQDDHHPHKVQKHCIPVKKYEEAPAPGTFTAKTGGDPAKSRNEHHVDRHAVFPTEGTLCFANCHKVIQAGVRAPIAGWFFADARLHGRHVSEGAVSDGPGNFCPEGHGESPVDDYVHLTGCKDASTRELQGALQMGDAAVTCEIVKDQCGKHGGKVIHLCPVTCKVCKPPTPAPTPLPTHAPGNHTGGHHTGGGTAGSAPEDSLAKEAAEEATAEFDKDFYGKKDTPAGAKAQVADVVKAAGYSSGHTQAQAEKVATDAVAAAKKNPKAYTSGAVAAAADAKVEAVAKAAQNAYASGDASGSSRHPRCFCAPPQPCFCKHPTSATTPAFASGGVTLKALKAAEAYTSGREEASGSAEEAYASGDFAEVEAFMEEDPEWSTAASAGVAV